MKTKIIHRQGQVALVIDDPTKKAWDMDRLALMEECADSGCWRLVDIRLRRYPQLSPYATSLSAEDYHATFKPKSVREAQSVRAMLREYREDPDGTLHWCSFDGIVRGHEEINGYRPPRYLDFDQAGYFSRKEGLQRLAEIKQFWDGYEGTLADARIDNPYRQPLQGEVLGRMVTDRLLAERDARIAALPSLEKQAGAAYTLWQFASEALSESRASGAAVNWSAVEDQTIVESILCNGQPREAVRDVLVRHSPLRTSRDSECSMHMVNERIDAVLKAAMGVANARRADGPELGL